MSVKIRIDPGSAGGDVRELTLTLPVITIGRDPGCAVVLSDPQKHVSRAHATILRSGDGYQLAVGSKVNPVLVNGKPCGFGQTASLADGDVLAIPPFTMTFRVIADDDATAIAPARPPAEDWLDMPAAPPAPAEPDPLDLGNLFGAAPAAKGPPPPDPFRLPEAPARSAVDDGARLPDQDLLGGLDSTPVDPLAALERKSSRPSAGSFAFDLDAFPVNDATSPRSGTSPAGSQGSLAESMPNPLVDLGNPRELRGAPAPDHVHDFNLPYHPPRIEEPASPAPARAEPAPAQRPTAPPEKTVVETRSPTGAAAAFLAGLGLGDVANPPADEEAFLRLAGAITRTAVEGIMVLLSSRGEMKKELRAPDRTMLAARNNNPLKLMADAQEALSFLFDPGQRPAGAFMEPAQAMQDACEDIRAHEIGLVAGTRAAVEGSIRRFDPAIFEKLAETEKGGGLLSNRRARLWDLYVDRYRKTELDLADNIDRLFERDFLRAYSEQVKRLRRNS